MAKKRFPLSKRFNATLSEPAYAKLRSVNTDYGLGNNYILTVLPENLDGIVDDGAPTPATMGRPDSLG